MSLVGTTLRWLRHIARREATIRRLEAADIGAGTLTPERMKRRRARREAKLGVTREEMIDLLAQFHTEEN